MNPKKITARLSQFGFLNIFLFITSEEDVSEPIILDFFVIVSEVSMIL